MWGETVGTWLCVKSLRAYKRHTILDLRITNKFISTSSLDNLVSSITPLIFSIMENPNTSDNLQDEYVCVTGSNANSSPDG